MIRQLTTGLALRSASLCAFAVLSACASAPRGDPRTVADPPETSSGPRQGLSVFDADARLDLTHQSLSVRWSVRFVSDSASAREAAFLLNPRLVVEAATGRDVTAFRVEENEEGGPSRVVVSLGARVQPGSIIDLELTYSGRPDFGDGPNAITEDWVELNLDGFWHPVATTFDQQLVGTLRVELPRDWDVVAPGRGTQGNGAHQLRYDLPQVDVALVAAPAFVQRSGDYFTVYHRQASAASVSAVLDATENCARYLNARYGSLDSLRDGRVVLADRDEVGYARRNYIVLSRVDPAAPIPLHRFVCHELAHFWTVSVNFMSPDHWMSEAFAEFVAGRFIREQFGDAAFQPVLAQWEEVGRGHGPVWSPEATRRPHAFAMYRRAPYLLYRLEERIGSAQADAFVARYMVQGARTTPELLGHLHAVAGPDVVQWFTEALASQGAVGSRR